MFGKKKVAEIAREIADHLQVIEHVKALQTAQKEMADELRSHSSDLERIRSEMAALKAETKFEALKETQQIVNAVQGSLNERIETLAIKIAVMDGSTASPRDAISSLGLPSSRSSRLSPPKGR